jgi:hypothetical protein
MLEIGRSIMINDMWTIPMLEIFVLDLRVESSKSETGKCRLSLSPRVVVSLYCGIHSALYFALLLHRHNSSAPCRRAAPAPIGAMLGCSCMPCHILIM